MERKKLILFFCVVALLLPNIATAQGFRIFAKKKIVVADVIDRNDSKFDIGFKTTLRQNIIDACTSSEDYEVFEINMNDIRQQLKLDGKSPSPSNVCKKIGEVSDAKYIIFTELNASTTDFTNPNCKIYISSQLYRIETASMVQTLMEMAIPTLPSVESAISRLVAGLLGSQVNTQYNNSDSQHFNPNIIGLTPRLSNILTTTERRVIEKLIENMVYVEGGMFRMGATSEQGTETQYDESPIQRVNLSSYYICKYEVTQALWQAVMGETVQEHVYKMSFKHKKLFNTQITLLGLGDNYPIYYVNYNEALEFCKRLSELTGLTFRLPTEAEWEYAARGGNLSKGYKYSGSNNIYDVAWYSANAGLSTRIFGLHSVGTKAPNELGLYDMSGNACEWCSDLYVSYNNRSGSNSLGPTYGSYRVLRGGSWCDNAQSCRVSYRGKNTPSDYFCFNGFRIVCEP